MDEPLHDERVERRDGRRLRRRRVAAEQRPEHDDRQQHLPLGVPERRGRFADAERRVRPPLLNGLAHAERGEQRQHQEPGQEAADEQILDGHVLRDDAVEDQRHRQREEQAERSRRREQADREALAVALLEQRRQQQAAERENRDAGSAGEQREERAERRRGDGRSARRPAEQRPQRAQQPLGRLALGEQEPGQREERDRREVGRRRRQLLVGLDERHDRPAAVDEERDHRDAAEQREDRRAEHAGDEDRHEPGQQRAALRRTASCCAARTPEDDARRAAIARPDQCGDARHASRSAISVKAIGKASVDDPDAARRAR